MHPAIRDLRSKMNDIRARLPRAGRTAHPQIETAAGAVLLVSTLVALLLSQLSVTTQRYMHLSPATIEGAIRVLEQRTAPRGDGERSVEDWRKY